MSRPLAVPRRIASPAPDGSTLAVVVPTQPSQLPPSSDALTIWRRCCPDSRGSSSAEAAIIAEARRPLAVGRTLRAVAMIYPDGQAHLVLVGDRTSYDLPGLLTQARRIAAGEVCTSPTALSGPAAPAEILFPPREAVSPFVERPSRPINDDLVIFRPWPTTEPAVLADLLAAIAVVLARLDRCTRPALAAHVTADGEPCDRTVLITPMLSNETTVTDLVMEIEEALRGRGIRGSDRLNPTGPSVGVGVFDVSHLNPGERVLPAATAPFPLTLCPVSRETGWEMIALARGEDAELAEVDQLLDVIHNVHRQIAAHTGTVNALTLISPQDIPQHTPDIKGGNAPTEMRLEDAFAAVAASRSGAIAITDAEGSISYAELDEYATRLSAGLTARGVVAGDLVGLCLEPSTNLVAAMIAVLRAGAAYVPTDPAYPNDRLQYTVEDAGVRLVITDRDAFPGGVVAVVTPAQLRATTANTPTLAGSTAEEPAYVIYTSGSTGRPKGVLVAHRSVTALIKATRDDFDLRREDVWSLFHSSAFDFSVWEIWGALLTGGRLVVVPYWTSRDPGELWQMLHREGVTVLSQTPSAFRQLDEIDAAQAQRLRVRLVVFGGEPLDSHRLLSWFDRYPETSCRLVNMFGITETTVHVTSRTLRRVDALNPSGGVGQAIAGWSVTVRDEQLRPVPVGFPGEILVGGSGLAIGYLGKRELTAKRFVIDPITGERLYCSGDLGRLRPDGELVHLGRIDNQVKVRGFRIELGEVASVLESVPGVTTAAVVVGGDIAKDPANARLDAYVVVDGCDTSALRARTAQLLPAHMVPATITALSALPLTSNGKLDVSALPDPRTGPPPETLIEGKPTTSTANPKGGPGEVASSLVERMCTLWSDQLGVPVSPEDNFFTLGGNSLLAVRLTAAMRAAGMPPLSLRLLYLNHTPAALTAALEKEADV